MKNGLGYPLCFWWVIHNNCAQGGPGNEARYQLQSSWDCDNLGMQVSLTHFILKPMKS